MSDILLAAIDKFTTHFGHPPTVASSAPGRVNLIGEHTDYNMGFVLPMALLMKTVVVGHEAVQDLNSCQIMTMNDAADEPRLVPFTLPEKREELQPLSTPKWVNYCLGVIANFHAIVKPFDCVVYSSVPIGGGLSSSASLEVAFYTFLEALTNNRTTQEDKALRCQKAEHEFAHVPCGIMDQYIATFAQPGNALLLDCRSLETKQIPCDPSAPILIIDSQVKHELMGSEYPERQENCFKAAETLGVASLRDANLDMLSKKADEMSVERLHRARHVITEIERTVEAAEQLTNGNFVQFGELMNKSHESLKTDYEVSCAEVDAIVDICQKFDGVYGARMTGAGFGGCLVVMLKSGDAMNRLIDEVKKQMPNVKFYKCQASGGTTEEDIPS